MSYTFYFDSEKEELVIDTFEEAVDYARNLLSNGYQDVWFTDGDWIYEGI